MKQFKKDNVSEDDFQESGKKGPIKNILQNDQDFSVGSCFDPNNSYDHRKQGNAFNNEENIDIKNMRKQSIGNSILNFDSMIRDDRMSNTPQSVKENVADQQKRLSAQHKNRHKNIEFSSFYQDGTPSQMQRQINRQKILQSSIALENILPNQNEISLQNSQVDLNISKKELGSNANFADDLNNDYRNALAPSDSQQLIMQKKKTIDTIPSKYMNGLLLDNHESVVKVLSRYDGESTKKNDQLYNRSINRNDSNPNTEQQQNQQSRNGTILNNNKAAPSFKFLISIKPKIKRFISNMTVSGRTKLLNDEIREYINDITDFRKGIQPKHMIARIFAYIFFYLEKLFDAIGLSKIPLFDPESKLKIVINSIIVTYNCFYILLVSIILIFDLHLGHHEHTFTYIAMASWITEMVVEMNTACYHHNHFITDRRIIIQIYAKEYFFFEILPLIFEGRSSENTLHNILLHLPLLLKLKGMTIILKKLEFYILQILDKHYIFQLFKLIMQMLLYGHVVACCWNLIVKLETNILHSITWFDGNTIDSTEWWKRYLIAQYWAFSVMMNVTTKPTTPLELAFTSLIMLLSCIAFGYLLSTVAGIIADLNKQQEEYKKDLNILNTYMKRKKVDLSVKRRVNINLKTYYQQKSRDNLKVESQALSKLSSEMLYELNCQANSRILKQFPFFSKLFSEQTLTKVYSIMEEEVYAPQQIIHTKNSAQFGQHYLYLILKGEVCISIEHFVAPNELDEFDQIQQEDEEEDLEDEYNQSVIRERRLEPCLVRKAKNVEDKAGVKKKMLLKQQGQIFGAYSFFTGNERLIDVQCKEFTTIIKINRQKFVDIVRENKKDYERFCEIKDKMTFNRFVDDIPDQYCMICHAKDHLFDSCHFGHFNKNNLLLFFKYNYSSFQERRAFNRKDQKFKSLQIKSQVHKQLIDYRCDRGIEFYSTENENSDGSDDQSDSNSQISETHNRMKKSMNHSKFHVEDDARLVYSSIHQQQSPLQTKNYPASDFDIVRQTPEEEANRMKTHSQKQNVDDVEKMMLQEENHTPLRSPSPVRKQSAPRQLKSKKSLVKFDSQQSYNNNNSNNVGVSQMQNNNNQNNNAARYEHQTSSLANRRKLSNLNITSPKHGSEYESTGKQEQVINKKMYNHSGTNHTYQSYGTNHSIGNNQNMQNINNHQNHNMIYGNNNHQPIHYSAYHQEKSHKQIITQEKEIQLDQAQSQLTKLSNQKGGNTNQFNYRKTMTMLPFTMMDEHNFIWGFDKQKDFQFYFPYFNQQNVVRRVNNYLNKIQKIKKLKSSGKKYTEIGGSKKKKQYSMTNINSKTSSMSRINTNNLKNPSKVNNNNEFSLNLVQLDVIKGDKTGTNLANKDDKILKDFLKMQGDN